MLQAYRYISARTLLVMPKLARCQSLPKNTWTSAENLWHLLFISHRWGSHNDPDPSGTQLTALKLMVQKMVDIAEAISDDQVGVEAVQNRLSRVSSLREQGTLQAAHLVFRSLCTSNPVSDSETIWNNGLGILDVVGFWFDYSCLPQDPKTPSEESEFAQALQGIGNMILSPNVSTLILRQEGDGYLSRGWCFTESIIACSKQDTNLPLALYTEQCFKPFSIFDDVVNALMMQWEDISSSMNAWEVFSLVIQATAPSLVLKSGRITKSEFALALADTTDLGTRLIAAFLPLLLVLPEGGHLNLSIHLTTLLQNRGLGCRDDKDYILVSLLLLTSLIQKNPHESDLAIFYEALIRFTEGLPLYLTRRNGILKWQDSTTYKN